MRRTRLIVVALLVAAFGTGCLGGIRKGTAQRLARKEYEHPPECPPKQVKTQIVREIDDRPDGIDYAAVVKTSGCGAERLYLCAQGGSDWRCEPVKE